MSRIGQKLIPIPKGVKISLTGQEVSVEGPKGKLLLNMPRQIRVSIKGDEALVERQADVKSVRALHGTVRALLHNMVVGVSEGYVKELEIQGVGFRAQVQGRNLHLALGFSHPIEFKVPEGITVEAPKLTQIFVKGSDKQQVGEVAAQLRDLFPPEPYKGKGIRYAGEHVRKKAGKAVG